MKKTGRSRRKTRQLFKKHKKRRGKISSTRYLQSFKEGDRVKLTAESAFQKGMYHSMFYGRNGIIQGKKGRCYAVLITDGSKQKTLIVHPVHLQKITNLV